MLRESKGNMYEFVDFQFNPVKGHCRHDCDYCLIEGTQILMSDFTCKPIELIRESDEVIGLQINKNGFKRLIKTKVLGVMSRKSKTIRINTINNSLECTPEHRILGSTVRRQGSSDWKQAKAYAPYEYIKYLGIPKPKTKASQLMMGHSTKGIPVNEIIGMTIGQRDCWVYNIQTECENYIANGFIVHNCYVKRFPVGNLRLDAKELITDLGKGNTLLICSGTDLFQESVPLEWILAVLSHCKKYSENTYLFQSKNPKRFLDFLGDFPPKTVLGCYDEKTRVLTPDGYKNYNELKIEDAVFSLNPSTEEIEINKIEHIFIKKYEGEMIRMKGKRIDLLLTPDHKVLRKSNHNTKLIFEDVKRLKERNSFYLPLGHWKQKNTIEYLEIDNKNILLNDVCYLMGIFIGDGWAEKNKIKRTSRTGLKHADWLRKAYKNGKWTKLKDDVVEREYLPHRIILSIPRNDKARNRVENLLKKYGIKYSGYEKDIFFASKGWQAIFSKCGGCAREKIIPKWALEQSKEALEHLFFGLMDSDGYGNRRYVTISPKILSGFNELCMKLGKTVRITKEVMTNNALPDGRINKNVSIIYRISCGKTAPFMKSKNLSCEYYSGMIWCCSVKNKNLFIERDGVSAFCGNSTIESNRPYSVSKAPIPEERMKVMCMINKPKFVTVEPIMDFDVDVMVDWMKAIKPDWVNIGADSNRKKTLPEPDKNKIGLLIEGLNKAGIKIKLKKNLARLF